MIFLITEFENQVASELKQPESELVETMNNINLQYSSINIKHIYILVKLH